jgi:hypothetical protein
VIEPATPTPLNYASPGPGSGALLYRSPAGQAKWVIVWLVIVLVCVAASIVVDAAYLGQVYRWLADENLVTGDEVAVIEKVELASWWVTNLATFATGVQFLHWMWRVRRNLDALGVRKLRWAKWWAIGAWLVPVLSLWRPFQVLREIWNASDPERGPTHPRGWEYDDVPPVMGWWWTLWVLASIVSFVGASLWRSAREPADYLAPTWTDIAAAAASIGSAVLAIQVVRRLTERQDAKAAAVAAALIAAPPTATATAGSDEVVV